MPNTKTYHLKKRSISINMIFLLLTSFLISKGTSLTTVVSKSVCQYIANFSFSGMYQDSFTISQDPVSLNDTIVNLSASINTPKAFTSSCHVIKMGSSDNEISFGTSAREIQYEFTATDSSNFSKIILVGIYQFEGTGTNNENDIFLAMKNKLQDEATNEGYLGYTSNSVLYIMFPKSLGKFNFEGSQLCPTEPSTQETTVIRRNCLLGGTDLSEYFINQASYSVGTWMLLGLICFFFCLLLGSSDEMNMDNENLRDNVLTLHPIYSVFMVGTDQFTKGSRYCQMTVSLTMMYLISGIIINSMKDTNSFDFTGLLFVTTICGIILAWIITYITGFILQRARNVDRDFLEDVKNNFSGSDLKTAREQYQRDSFVRYYEYYCICGLLVLISVIGNFLTFFLILIFSKYDPSLWNRRANFTNSFIFHTYRNGS